MWRSSNVEEGARHYSSLGRDMRGIARRGQKDLDKTVIPRGLEVSCWACGAQHVEKRRKAGIDGTQNYSRPGAAKVEGEDQQTHGIPCRCEVLQLCRTLLSVGETYTIIAKK